MFDDLYPQAIDASNRDRPAFDPRTSAPPDPGFWRGFASGSGRYAMRAFAETGRAIDLAGSVAPIALDALTGGTERQDRYFAEHDEVFNRAVDHWTPRPGEVGAAGQMLGSLVGSLPVVIANPALAVGATELSAAEDLIRHGVKAGPAGAVGAIQAASLAVGLRLPYLGKTLASRLISGAAGNVAQGAAGAEASHLVLSASGNEEAAKGFNALDPTARTLDALMGAAFGGVAHLDAKAQAARRAVWDQASKDALLVLNQARHLDEVAAPAGASPFELNKGVAAVRQAMDQMLRGEPVTAEVPDIMRSPYSAEATRQIYENEAAAEASRAARETITDAMATNEGLRIASETPGFLRTPEQQIAVRAGQPKVEGSPELARAIEIANKPGFLRTAQEKIIIERALRGELFDHLIRPIEPATALGSQTAPEAPGAARPPKVQPEAGSPTGAGPSQAGEAKVTDPLVETAKTIAAERPDLMVPDENGKLVSVGDYLNKAAETARRVNADAGLFRTALTCLLGVA